MLLSGMKTINLIFGASGFAKDVDWLINELYEIDNLVDYRPHYFVAHESDSMIGKRINDVPIISENNVIRKFADSSEYLVNVFICIANPLIKENIFNKIKMINNFQFPTIVHPNTSYDKRKGKVRLGQGVIICSNNVFSTDVELGSFVHVNLSCTIGHDSSIGSFSTISPGVNISGKVNIEEKTFLGTNATVLENLSIVSNVIVGAGAVIVKNLDVSGTYVGYPAKRVR